MSYTPLNSPTSSISSSQHEEGTGTWTPEEHERFLAGIALYPNGPWKRVAAIVKTRTVRQLRTHAQKYREKLARIERRAIAERSFQFATNCEPISVVDIEKFHLLDPIAFEPETIQYDECMQFLVDALEGEKVWSF
ncbi:hypothetical protein AC1031_020712 [Aphanomyces cochlioides]|nr:hypothetical protein AC1031_020712 [Aphanomyces cochlioides]